jgi:hypothetical protein
MKFETTVNVSEREIKNVIREAYSYPQTKKFILDILPRDWYSGVNDADFMLELMVELANRTVKELSYNEMYNNSKKMREIHKQLKLIREQFAGGYDNVEEN